MNNNSIFVILALVQQGSNSTRTQFDCHQSES